MDEARRFLRYVVPGVLFVVETVLLLVLALPDWAVPATVAAVGQAGLGTAIAALLASGGLGFLFATVHHEFHWRKPHDPVLIDHSPFILRLEGAGLLTPARGAGDLSREEALVVLTAEWFARSGSNEPIGNATARATALSDLMHSLGTAQVASGFALIISCVVCATAEWSPTLENMLRYVGMLVVGAAFVSVFHRSYRRTGRITQRFYEYLLENTLRKEAARREMR